MTTEPFSSIHDVPKYVEAAIRDYDLPGAWRFTWMKSARTLGEASVRARHGQILSQTISLSIPFVRVCLPHHQHEIVDTILHEIAHARVGLDEGHGCAWKDECRRIGARPAATKDISLFPSIPTRWLGRCSQGRHLFRRMRLIRNTRNGTCVACDREQGGENPIRWARNPAFDKAFADV